MNAILTLELSDKDPKPPVKAAKKPAKEEPKIPFYFTNYIGDSRIVKRLRSQLTVDNLDIASAGFKTMEGIIRHNLTMAMMKELESHIKVERMPPNFTEYGSTVYVGKLDVVE